MGNSITAGEKCSTARQWACALLSRFHYPLFVCGHICRVGRLSLTVCNHKQRSAAQSQQILLQLQTSSTDLPWESRQLSSSRWWGRGEGGRGRGDWRRWRGRLRHRAFIFPYLYLQYHSENTKLTLVERCDAAPLWRWSILPSSTRIYLN